MSFTSIMKQELTRIESNKCCKKAELSSLARLNGSLTLGASYLTLTITTENATIARYIFSLLKNIYNIVPDLIVRRKTTLKKNRIYLLSLSRSSKEVLTNLGILNSQTFINKIPASIIRKQCCKKAYLRGAFLASGSINDPSSSSYHLEITSTYFEHGKDLWSLCNYFHLNAKIMERKRGTVMYLKEADKIGDFINLLGAHPSLLRFENTRIMKDMRNSVNRLVNCETANLNKTIKAALDQLDHIRLISENKGLDSLPGHLQELAKTRVLHPELNFHELGQILPSGPISKSAVNYRLRKIKEIAEKLPTFSF